MVTPTNITIQHATQHTIDTLQIKQVNKPNIEENKSSIENEHELIKVTKLNQYG